MHGAYRIRALERDVVELPADLLSLLVYLQMKPERAFYVS